MVDRSAALKTNENIPLSPNLEPKSPNMGDDKDKINSVEQEMFLKKVEVTKVEIENLKKLVDQVEGAHSRYLQAVNDDFKDKYRVKLSEIIYEVTELNVKITNTLKIMDSENKELEKNGKNNDNDYRIRLTQQGMLTTQFRDIIQKYNDVQISYKEKYELSLEKQYKIVNPEATKEEVAEVVKSGKSVFSYSAASKDKASKIVNEVQERFEDLKKVEQSLIELHQLFLDLSVLVSSQGDKLSRIDANVDGAVDYTTKGVENMAAALKQQKKNRKRMFYGAMCVSFVLIILVVALVKVI